MTVSLSTDILQFLHDQGVVDGVTGWEGKYNYMPPQPDQCVVVTETPGGPPDGSTGQKWDLPSFQIRVRAGSDGMEAATLKAFEIFDTLEDATISGFCFVFGVTSAPLFIGLDTNNRPEFTWNFNTMKER